MSNDENQSQEIEEILNEIDNLSEDLKDVGDEPEFVAAKPQPTPLHVVKAQVVDAPIPAKMSGSALLDAAIEMDAEPQESSIESFEDEDLGDQPMESNSEEGSLTMTLKGNMTLKLNYECAGQSVTVSFSEDALKIQMADGAEFKIPVHKNSQIKAA